MRNRILVPRLASVIVLGVVVVALSGSAGAGTFPGKNGRIAYTSSDGNDDEIYTIPKSGDAYQRHQQHHQRFFSRLANAPKVGSDGWRACQRIPKRQEDEPRYGTAASRPFRVPGQVRRGGAKPPVDLS